jgi:hypothetical protein
MIEIEGLVRKIEHGFPYERTGTGEDRKWSYNMEKPQTVISVQVEHKKNYLHLDEDDITVRLPVDGHETPFKGGQRVKITIAAA